MGKVSMEDRNMEKTVWSLPPLRSDIIDRRIAARLGSDQLREAIHRLQGVA